MSGQAQAILSCGLKGFKSIYCRIPCVLFWILGVTAELLKPVCVYVCVYRKGHSARFGVAAPFKERFVKCFLLVSLTCGYTCGCGCLCCVRECTCACMLVCMCVCVRAHACMHVCGQMCQVWTQDFTLQNRSARLRRRTPSKHDRDASSPKASEYLRHLHGHALSKLVSTHDGIPVEVIKGKPGLQLVLPWLPPQQFPGSSGNQG